MFDHLVQKNDGTTGRAGDKIYTISLPDHHIPVRIKNDWIIMSWIRNNSEITDLPPLYIFCRRSGRIFARDERALQTHEKMGDGTEISVLEWGVEKTTRVDA